MTPNRNDETPTRFDRLARRAKATLAFERIWPVIVSLLVLACVFLTVSWLGLWLEVPRFVRVGGSLLFAAALAYLAAGLWRSPAPTQAQALSRLDRDSGFKHRPASASQDQLANSSADPATQALWNLHQQRLAALNARMKLAPPSPRLVDKDRYALRAAALVGVVGAAFVAGPERYVRLAAAFDWGSAGAIAQGFRLDAWINPPAYTGRAPILLDTRIDGKNVVGATRIDAPVGSTLVLRGPADASFKAETLGALVATSPLAQPGDAAVLPASAGDLGQTFTLKGDAKLVLQRNGINFAAFDIHAIADIAPTIVMVEPFGANSRGSMTLNYKIADDYGVVSAQANFAKPSLKGKPVSQRSLAEPPQIGLTLPPAPGGLGEGTTVSDLSEHPWAGAKVLMTLSAKDEGGNSGSSEPREVQLPARPFNKPVARALVEQRRNLVLNPDERSRVSNALEALMLGPEAFHIATPVYLGLGTANLRLKAARTDAQLLEVADYLWEMALRIEDGDLSQTERDLRAAEARLREALQNGASQEEIAKLMAEMRAALDKFMQELAQKLLRENGEQQQAGRNEPRNGKTMTPQDFKSMMDRMEEMAKSGDLAQAQRMLDQMQKMLENLQAARPRGPSQAQKDMNKALDELDALAREEQALRDDTFKQDQKQRRQQRNAGKQPGSPQNGQPPRPRPNGQKGAQPPDQNDDADNADNDGSYTGDAQTAEQSQKALKDRQEALRQRLEQLQKRLKQLGQKGSDGLGQAEEAMKDAEDALGQNGQGNAGQAIGPEGKAMEGLRKGAQQLADAMQQQGEGEGDDQADGEDQPGQGQRQGNRQNGNSRDPLGRDDQRKNQQNSEKRGLNDQGAPAQRAQRVLEELRKRLGDTSRATEERDYLERLLKR